MKVTSLLLVFSLVHWSVDTSLLDPVVENVRHMKADHAPEKVAGIWKKKMLWKPRWLKQWKSSNVVKPVWKKFWGPVIIREWVPIPKPPPDWGPATKPFLRQKPSFQGTPFLDVGTLPEPNFGYPNRPSGNAGYSYDPPKMPFPLPDAPAQGSPFKGANLNYQAPHLPIGVNSHAETYAGQSSYGAPGDNGDFDLNPPVEQYDAQQAGYGYDSYGSSPTQTSSNQNGHQSSGQTHHHGHHHHHHHHHHYGHEHKSSDLSKFPPIWNSYKTPPAHAHSNLQQQASSSVSVVSKIQATTHRPGKDPSIRDYLVPPFFRPAKDDFIQQASLVGEYHYSEVAAANSTQIPPRTASKHWDPRLNNPKDRKTPPKPTHAHNLSHFKALPANLVETYHYAEPIPSNQTQSKATLIGKFNGTTPKADHQSSRVPVTTPGPHEKGVSPLVAQIAHAVVKEHIRNAQPTANTTRTHRSTTEAALASADKIKTPTSTARAVATESSSNEKKPENHSTREPSGKPQSVIIVTPLPHKKGER